MASAGYALPARGRGKPGELTLMIGLLLCAVAPFVLAIVHTEAGELALLKANGMIAKAEVIAHDSAEQARTNRKGQDRSTTSYLLAVRYDQMSPTRYSEWAAGAGIASSRYPVSATNTFEVSQAEQSASPVGSRQMVAFLAGDPRRMKLVSTIEAQTAPAYFARYYAAMAVMMLAGAWLTRRGWRQRKAAHG